MTRHPYQSLPDKAFWRKAVASFPAGEVDPVGHFGLRIGPEIDPGVPWTATLPDAGGRPLALALKSGNFGTPDFFLKAWSRLP